jgi:hypothetical protein
MRQVDARRVCHHLGDDAVRDARVGFRKKLLAWAGIDADHIAAAARRLFGK